MSARAFLREAVERGVTFEPDGLALAAIGPLDVIEELSPRIAAAKADILAILAEDSEMEPAEAAAQATPADRASAIVASTMAAYLARAVAACSGWLCARCARIGVVDADAVCTRCRQAEHLP